MSVVVNFVMGLASAGGVYFWAKTQLTKPDLTTERDLFPSRGVPLTKRARAAVTDHDSHGNEILKSERVTRASYLKREAVTELVVESEPVATDMAPIADASVEISKDMVPEDSVLKRHYFARCTAEREAITHPYPTDSILRRHHESMLAFSLMQDRNIEEKSEAVETSAAVSEHQTLPETVFARPEDSVLKRHFLAQLQAEIEQGLPTKPTEATLKRHYAQLLQSKLNVFLH